MRNAMDFHQEISSGMILWSDDSILAVNKPAGLRTIRDGYNPEIPYLPRILEQQFGRVWVVHRLDKDTSGVILFARTAEVHKALNTQFEQRETRKEYHAILSGIPTWEEVEIGLPLRVDGDRRHRTVIDHQSGKPAETTVRVLQPLGVFSLAAAFPHTGYTHQIRAHLAALGLPLLGDPLYKSLEPETLAHRRAREIASGLPIQRTALHARQISFVHPANGTPLTITAPYPDDFQQTLAALSALNRRSK